MGTQRSSFLVAFIKNIDQGGEAAMLSDAVAVADTFSMIQNADILRIFQGTIKDEYARVKQKNDKNAETVYGLLAGLFSKNALINESWLQEMSRKYKIEDVSKIKSKELFNREGLNIQQYFFYDDEDGEASFQSFISKYQNKKVWTIEDKERFVLIKSKTGKNMEIYANKPKYEEEGQGEINEILTKKNIETIIIVHRGHSFHVGKTIQRMPKTAKIVSLGSCGGYKNIDAVIERAPDAHIISTKGKGTMTVNDPLLYALNQRIINGKDVYWPEFWEQMKQKFGENEDFNNYVPPHKNIGVLFLKAYKKMAEAKND